MWTLGMEFPKPNAPSAGDIFILIFAADNCIKAATLKFFCLAVTH